MITFERHHGLLYRGWCTVLLGAVLLIATPYPGLALRDAPAPWLRDLCSGSMSSVVFYRVNAGGSTIASIDGGPNWLRDDGFHSGGSRVIIDRTVRGLDDSVPVSTPRSVFETERFNPPDTADLRYDLDVNAGTDVEVRFYMMNGFDGTSAPGTRIFDVEINGTLVLDDIDLSREFGHQIGGMRAARIRSDGRLRIVFKRNVQAPLINAIEVIVDGGASSVAEVLYRLNAGGETIASIDGGPNWLRDDGFQSGGSRVITDRTVRGLDVTVPPSTPRSVFETERFNPPDTADLRYDFDVVAGADVEVRFYMMNGFDGTSEPGTRIFGVEINGDLVLDDIDLSLEFGHQIGGMRAVRVRSDGRLRIVFKRNVQAPLVNAIEIVAVQP